MSKEAVEKMGFERNRRYYKDYKNQMVAILRDGKTINFRSRLEFYWANHLELLKRAGQIKDWQYETHTFIFDNIGTNKWLVDFVVRNNDDTFEYYECKGYLEKSDVTKLKLLNRERPEVKLIYVFARKPKISVKKWEYLERCCARIVSNAYSMYIREPKFLRPI